MGKLCSKQKQTVSSNIETEKEVTMLSYKSNADKYYELQENKYNYLKKINFEDYLYALVHFSNENATLEEDYNKSNIDFSMSQPFFCELFSTDIFQSFIENKILKHQSVYADAGNNEKVTTIFKEQLLALHNALGLKLAQDAKAKGDESADKNSITKKCDAIPYGLLYCVGANFVKIKAMFNIFSENQQLKPSEKLNEFLLSLFLIPSYCAASARNKLAKYDEVGSIEKDQLKQLLDSSELKDCQNLVDVTNKILFGNDGSGVLNYEQFKAKFENSDKDTSLSFLLLPSGVRYMLEKNNV